MRLASGQCVVALDRLQNVFRNLGKSDPGQDNATTRLWWLPGLFG